MTPGAFYLNSPGVLHLNINHLSSVIVAKEHAQLYVAVSSYISLSDCIPPAVFPSPCLIVCPHVARSKSMVLGELSRLSRPCSPQDQEKPLKAGWLKRQRSIMKNWQLRWFVLRTEALYFYKDQDESKAQVR